MVCGKCEKKLSKLGCPDKWKEGANNTGSDRKINENKMLSKAKKWAPYDAKCTTCKAALPKDYQFCQRCAYRKGICAMCGKQVLDTTGLKMSTA